MVNANSADLDQIIWVCCLPTVNVLKFQTLVACQKGVDQLRGPRSQEAVWSGYSLFAILTSILWIPALITLFNFRTDREKCEILEHIPYVP